MNAIRLPIVIVLFVLIPTADALAQNAPYLGTPEPFLETEEQQLAALNERHHELTDLYLYNVRTREERARMLVELKRIVRRDRPELETRKKNWERFYTHFVRWAPSCMPDPDVQVMLRRIEARMKKDPVPEETGESYEDLVHQMSVCDTALHALLKQGACPRFFLRRFLTLKARCYLRASVAYYGNGHPKNNRDHLRTYLCGVHLLESALELDQMLAKRHVEDVSLTDPGFQFWDRLDPQMPYTTIEYMDLLDIRQRLARYCPWGRTVFEFFHESGMLPYFDFRILESYQKSYDFMDTARGILGYMDIAPPMIQILDLSQEEAPPHIAREMQDAIGDRRIGHIIRGGVAEPHLWEYVGKSPVTRLWIISPMINNLSFGDRVKWVLTAVKLVVAGPLDVGVDAAIDRLYEWYGELVDEEGGVFVTLGLLIDGNNMGLDSQYILGSSDIKYWADPKRRNEFNPNKFFKCMLQKWADAASDWEKQCLFDWLDPHATGIPSGISYDGSVIPPIVIQSDVFGFDRQPADRYRSTRRVARFFQLDLRRLAGRPTYDLSSSVSPPLANATRYCSGDAEVIRQVWPVLPNDWQKRKFLGRREYAMDFTPRTQVIKLGFEGDLYTALTQDSEGRPVKSTVALSIPICPEGSPVRRRLGEWPLENSEVTIQLFDRSLDPTGIFPDRLKALREVVRNLDASNMSSQAAAAVVNAENAPLALSENMVPIFGPLIGSVTCELHTQYEVVINRAGKTIGPFPLRFLPRHDPGTEQRLWRTGTVRNVDGHPGMVEMRYVLEDEFRLEAAIRPQPTVAPRREVEGLRFERPLCLRDGTEICDDGGPLTYVEVKARVPVGLNELVLTVARRSYHFYAIREHYYEPEDPRLDWISFSGYVWFPLGQRLGVRAHLVGNETHVISASIRRQLRPGTIEYCRRDLDKALAAVNKRRETLRRDLNDPEWGTPEFTRRDLANDLRIAAGALVDMGRLDEAVMFARESCELAGKVFAEDPRQLSRHYFEAADILYLAGDFRTMIEYVSAGCSALEACGDELARRSSDKADSYFGDGETRCYKLANWLLVSGDHQQAMSLLQRAYQFYDKRRSPDKRRNGKSDNLKVFLEGQQS